jgi:hypothetical protein
MAFLPLTWVLNIGLWASYCKLLDWIRILTPRQGNQAVADGLEDREGFEQFEKGFGFFELAGQFEAQVGCGDID